MKKRKLIGALSISLLLCGVGVSIVSCNNDNNNTVTPEEKTGTVVIATMEHGRVTASATEGKVGDEITLTVTPDTGYDLETLTHNGKDIKEAKKFTLVEGENKIAATFVSTAVELSLDKTEVKIDEIGKKETLTATVKNTTDKVEWSITDETNFVLTVASDGLSAEVLNVSGGTCVVTASVGGVDADATIMGSIYGDQRIEYTVYSDAGTAVGDYKGLYNAINVCLNGTDAKKGYYVTKKGETEKVYTRTDSWLVSMTKTGVNNDYDGLIKNSDETVAWKDGALSSWFSGFGYNSMDTVSTKGMVFSENGGSYSRNIYRGTDFSKDLFLDGYQGYSDMGNPANSVWSGWRAALYSASVTTVQAITWADPYEWGEVDLNWDLSDSQLVPSYNATQDAIAQIYLGTQVNINKLHGIYFNAGNMTDNASLTDGTERDIYTFEETPEVSDGLSLYGKWGADRVVGTTSIGKAKWDAFNKCWTFPEVTINLNCKVYFSDDADNTDTNSYYYRDYTIKGFKGETEVGKVEDTDSFGAEKNRVNSSERTTWGVSFTPNYEEVGGSTTSLPDITCGAKWTNIKQITSVAHQMSNATKATDDNLQIVAGRTANYANQIGLYGADSVTMTHTTDSETLLNFEY